ncbi:MAG: hypothetical protein Kow0059_12650 [Candidatus Sumerlaeia bacterium]
MPIVIALGSVSEVIGKDLCTPAAYLTGAYPFDSFATKRLDAPLGKRLYTSLTVPVSVAWNPVSTFRPAVVEFCGGRLPGGRAGADQVFDPPFGHSVQLPNEPRNGLISLVDIRTSRLGGADPGRMTPPSPDARLLLSWPSACRRRDPPRRRSGLRHNTISPRSFQP